MIMTPPVALVALRPCGCAAHVLVLFPGQNDALVTAKRAQYERAGLAVKEMVQRAPE